MITVTVDLKQRSYPIFIGSGLLNQPGLLDPYIEGRDVLVVTSESIAPLYLEPLQQMLGQLTQQAAGVPTGSTYRTVFLPRPSSSWTRPPSFTSVSSGMSLAARRLACVSPRKISPFWRSSPAR